MPRDATKPISDTEVKRLLFALGQKKAAAKAPTAFVYTDAQLSAGVEHQAIPNGFVEFSLSRNDDPFPNCRVRYPEADAAITVNPAGGPTTFIDVTPGMVIPVGTAGTLLLGRGGPIAGGLLLVRNWDFVGGIVRALNRDFIGIFDQNNVPANWTFLADNADNVNAAATLDALKVLSRNTVWDPIGGNWDRMQQPVRETPTGGSATAASTATTGTKASYTVPNPYGARLISILCSRHNNATAGNIAVRPFLVRGGVLIPLSSAPVVIPPSTPAVSQNMMDVFGPTEMALNIGDVVRIDVTTALAGSSADFVISVAEWPLIA